MMKRLSLGLVVLGLSLGVTARAKGGLLSSFTPINVPGNADTEANGISNDGRIVGLYASDVSSSNTHGFLLSGGVLTTFDVPVTGSTATSANGVNVSGDITGFFTDANNLVHAYLLSGGVGGGFTQLDVPDSNSTRALSLNDRGQIVGFFRFTSEGSGTAPPTFVRHGFLKSGDVYNTQINFPDAKRTELYGINNLGQVVGAYSNELPPVVRHGFLLSGGVYTPLDVPGATFTIAEGIDDAGRLVGYYGDADGNNHGFLLSGGVYTPLDVPGATGTIINSINNAGLIVGSYDDATGTHGFLASVVPEPSSLLLFGTGVLGVLGYGLRRRILWPAKVRVIVTDYDAD